MGKLKNTNIKLSDVAFSTDPFNYVLLLIPTLNEGGVGWGWGYKAHSHVKKLIIIEHYHWGINAVQLCKPFQQIKHFHAFTKNVWKKGFIILLDKQVSKKEQ